jgi:hypothetical protein
MMNRLIVQKQNYKLLIKMEERQKEQNNYLVEMKVQQRMILNELITLNRNLSKICGSGRQPLKKMIFIYIYIYIYVLVGPCKTCKECFVVVFTFNE